MTHPSPIRTSVVLAVLASLMTSVGGWTLYRRATEPPPYVRHPLGEPLPNVQVQEVGGAWVQLRARLGGRPALIYVFSAAQCASCSNLRLEFGILKGAYPQLQPLLVGSGASREEFARTFATMEIGDAAVVDESRALMRALHVAREPVVLLADSTGRIVFVDQRSPSQAAQYPMGRVLVDLQGALGTRRAGVSP